MAPATLGACHVVGSGESRNGASAGARRSGGDRAGARLTDPLRRLARLSTLPAAPAALAIGGFILCAAALDLSLEALLRFVLPYPDRLDAVVVPIAALGAAALVRRCAGRPGWRAVAAGAGVVAALLLVAAAFYDTSWDGESYHLPGVITLAGGWNPVAGPSGIERVDIWPSGSWFLRAQLARGVGCVEAGKAMTGILALASLLLWAGTLEALTGRPLSGAQRLGVLVLAANPVVLAQLSTFYLDSDVAVLSMSLLAGVLLTATEFRGLGVAIACAATVLLVNSKISGVYYAAVLGAGGCFAAPLPLRQRGRLLLIGAAAWLFACVVVGWRPFVTSTLAFGTPIYTAGWTWQRPPNLVGVPPPLQLLAALFARTGGAQGDAVAAKLPFVVTPHEALFMATPDTRVGGFGPLFGLALLLALGGTFFSWRAATATRHGQALLRTASVVAIACALFPEAWWTRLVGVAWCIPVLLVLAWPETGRRLSRLRAGVFALLLSGSVLALGGNLARAVWRDRQMTALIERLRPQAPLALVREGPLNFDVTLADRFARAGVAARLADAADCGREIETYRGSVRICTARRDQP